MHIYVQKIARSVYIYLYQISRQKDKTKQNNMIAHLQLLGKFKLFNNSSQTPNGVRNCTNVNKTIYSNAGPINGYEIPLYCQSQGFGLGGGPMIPHSMSYLFNVFFMSIFLSCKVCFSQYLALSYWLIIASSLSTWDKTIPHDIWLACFSFHNLVL